MKLVILSVLILLAFTNATNWSGGSALFTSVFGAADLAVDGVANINAAVTATIDADLTSEGLIEVGDDSIISAFIDAHLVISAGTTTVNDLIVKAGDVVVEAGASLVVTGNLTLQEGTKVVGDVVVEGNIIVEGAADFGEETKKNATVLLKTNAEAWFNKACKIYSAFKAEGSAKLYITGDANAEFSGIVDVSTNVEINLEADATFTAKNESHMEGNFEGSGTIVFDMDSDAEATVRAFIGGTTHKCKEFIIKGKSRAETTKDIAIEGAVKVQSEGKLIANHIVDVSANLAAEGNARVEAAEEDIKVAGEATFAAGTTYAVKLQGDTEKNIKKLVVTGAATLNGALELSVSANFEIKTDIVIMTHGSASGKFSSVTEARASSKRADEDYTVAYGEDETTVSPSGEDNNAMSFVPAMAVLVLVALIA